MTTFVLSKDRFTAIRARTAFQDRLAILSAKGRKTPAIGSTVQIKVGKDVVTTGAVLATATLVFTPIALRRVLDLKSGGEAGETIANLLKAAEQGASQADEHLAKLAQLVGFERWALAHEHEGRAGAEGMELTRKITVITLPFAVAGGG
ncbi:hypothetical protein [Caulobacter sp. X]|uniref:hypothetical protein n=1 Tax=Caulobacter sp. X TaxID=2048901 RepID=UPI000C146FF5|nr:hypothetical protein [Caulobacter sp. X]PIB96479.1 hypothetical protein CSW60_18395 [Caulobacter sp. X]